jgi:PatG C-terminal
VERLETAEQVVGGQPSIETAEQVVGGQPLEGTQAEGTQAEGTQAPAAQENAGATTPSYVYAVGLVEPRYPSLAVEKEVTQATSRAEGTAGLTDQQVLHSLLSDRANRYLVRQMCFVLTIEGLETYILQPRDPADFEYLVEAIRPIPSPADRDVVIGIRGPIASAEACNGLMVPIVGFDQIYSFDVDSFVESIPRPEDLPEDEQERFGATAEQLFYRIMQIADNAGATDEHRALNYLAVRYDRIYASAAERFRDNFSLTGVEVRPSRLSGTRKVMDVIFSYTNRNTDVTEKEFVRVDVTEEFPFLVTGLSPFYER